MAGGKVYPFKNYVEIDGKDVLFDSLPPEERRRVSLALADKLMGYRGYQRVGADREHQGTA